MKKGLLLSFVILLLTFNVFPQLQVGDWRLYSVFSGLNVQSIIDTGGIVYYLSDGYLFSYDKENDETVYYNKRNNMSDVDITDIYYNYDKNYLFVAYSNSNIDLLYDDGSVVNMPDLKNTVLTGSKTINSVDFQDSEVYVATDFGYMVLDDENYVIKESFNYGKVFNSIIATDKYLYAAFDSNIWVSAKNENHFYISSFIQTSCNFSTELVKISNTKALCGTGWFYALTLGNESNITNIPVSVLKNQDVRHLTKSRDGFIASLSGSCMRVDNDGKMMEEITLPSEIISGGLISSMETDGSLWGVDSDGVKQFRIEDNGSVTILHDNYRPNVLSVSYPFFLNYSNNRLYVMNTGANNWLTDQFVDFGMSSMEDGTWKDLAPDNVSGLINNNSRGRLLSPYGLAVDPQDADAVWFGSRWEGVFCVKDNNQIQKFDSNNAPMTLDYICAVPDLKFDSNMNLWCVNDNELNPDDINLFALPAAKRFTSVGKSDFVTFRFPSVGNCSMSRLLITSDDIILLANNAYKTSIVALDYNGTLENKADDRQVIISSFTDQDGRTFDISYVYNMVEEDNGRIWLATNTGVGYINSIDDLFSNNVIIYRAKIPRNDGTNLADYLLDGIGVSSVAIDGAGRKWFGTTSSGLYLVNSDGSEILEHFTAENSYLPSDFVLSVICNPDNNSVYIGTDKGFVEYSSDAVTAEQDFNNVYAYPNPVRPDYTGYITIRGLMENSLVKIADSAGNVVYSTKSNGGMAMWDGCNSSGRRVDTGVYFVFASQSADGSSEGCVTKILVVR